MSYVWDGKKIERYRSYYNDIRTHHTYTYVQYETTKDFVRSVLPPCLDLPEDPKVTIGFMSFMEWVNGIPNREGRDRAAIIGVNARHQNVEGSYYLTVLETEEVNIVTGREFWGMPKKQGYIDFFEDGESFHGFAGRKEHRLIEMECVLGGPEPVSQGDELEYYFDLRGYAGVNATGFTQPQLVIFKNSSAIKRLQHVTSASVILNGSPFDPGVGTVPLGEFREGAHLGGETSYIVSKVVDLSGDGTDYTPYLMGRLYDDWPDVRRPNSDLSRARASVR